MDTRPLCLYRSSLLQQTFPCPALLYGQVHCKFIEVDPLHFDRDFSFSYLGQEWDRRDESTSTHVEPGSSFEGNIRNHLVHAQKKNQVFFNENEVLDILRRWTDEFSKKLVAKNHFHRISTRQRFKPSQHRTWPKANAAS